MKKTLLLLLVIFLIGGCSLPERFQKKNENETTKIRIGWQIPWATQGQLVQVLKNTEILKDNKLEGEFKGFSSGAPLNEAALAGEVDVLFTADQPAVTLISKNPNWVIIGRLMYNRVSLYVPPASPIFTVVDLKGKTVAMPFGAAAQRIALAAEKDAGLNPDMDVKNINLGIYEQGDLVRDSQATKWGEIDALAGFDPTPAIFEEKGLIRNLHVGKVVSVIVMSKDFINQNPDAPIQFLRAFRDAYDYYRQNVSEANDWFVKESGLEVSSGVLDIAARVEPNLQATDKSEIRLWFSEEDRAIMQSASDFLFEQKIINKAIEIRDYINEDYLNKI